MALVVVVSVLGCSAQAEPVAAERMATLAEVKANHANVGAWLSPTRAQDLCNDELSQWRGEQKGGRTVADARRLLANKQQTMYRKS